MNPAAAHVVPRTEELPLTTAIARPARLCYELFCAAERTPEWVSVVRSARVARRNAAGRPEIVAFLANLRRATLGYRLHYTYRERDLGVSWTTAADANIVVAGWAQFTPLSDKATLLTYQLQLDTGGALAAWDDPSFDGHAASAVMSDFREFVTRTSP